MSKMKESRVDAEAGYDSDDEGPEKPVERSCMDKFINYLLCRGDLARETLKVRPVPFLDLFRYCGLFELFLLGAGILGAIISGVAQPMLAYISGEVFNLMLQYPPDSYELLYSMYDYVYIYLGLGVFIIIVNFLQYYCFDRVCSRCMGRMREAFIKSILRQNAGWYDKEHAGALITQLNDNMERIREGVGDKLGLLIRGCSMFMASLILSFVIEWRLALFMSLVAPCSCICMSIMSRKLAATTAKELKDVGRAGAVAEEAVLGVRTVQAFNGQEEMVDRYGKELKKGSKHALRKSFWSGLFGGLFFLILQTYMGCGLLYGGYLLRVGAVPAPGVVFTVVMSMMIGAYFLGLISPQLMVILNARVAAAAVYKTIDRIPKIDAYSKAGLSPRESKGRIEFRDVHFRYPTRKTAKVLDGFTLAIEPGETIAFVGHSGCGKSTAVGLLTRLYEAERGQVLVDGVDVRDLNIQWLRNTVGIVQQEPILFNDSLAENIRMGRPDITPVEMEDVCRRANAHDFITKLPMMYESMIGDGGIQLSGGQKQRIAIARTLARNPRILLLDEATSALDAESESIVQQALDSAAVGRTTILIAHRLSTVRNANRIVVFDKGRIAEMGTHEELIEKQGRYAKLVEAQKINSDVKDTVTEDEDEEETLARTPADRALGTRRRLSSASSTVSRLHGKEAFVRGAQAGESRRSTRTALMAEMPNECETFAAQVEEQIGKDGVTNGSLFRVFRAGGWQVCVALLLSVIRGFELPVITVAFSMVYAAFDLYKVDVWQMQHHLILCLIVYVCCGTLTFSSQFASSYMFGRSSERAMLSFRISSLRSILHQDAAYFDNPVHAPGKLITRLATDSPNVKAVLDPRMMSVVYNLTAWLVCIIMSLVVSWPIGVLGFILSTVLGLGLMLLAHIIQKSNIRLAKKNNAGKLSIEIVEGVRTIQLLTREERFLNKYAIASQLLGKSDGYRGKFEAGNFALSQTFIYFSLAACYALAAQIIFHRMVTANDAYNSIVANLLACIAIMQSSSFFPEIVKARSASALLFNIIDRKPATGDIDKGNKVKLNGNVFFENIRFAYPQRPHQPILRGLQFTALKGQTVALVGPSGAGKSSVVSLLERFYDTMSGAVKFDGADLKTASLRSIREQMALVGQEPRLFAGTIRDNVKFGLSHEVSDAAILEALHKANATDFMTRMPEGLDTEVGEKGTQLSGGQKQRIAIARALIRNPAILLLDEATSALDTESEKAVQEALNNASDGRTCITIAHRLSSIQNADKIVYIEGGAVMESGTHQQLLAIKGRYYKLIKKQDLST